MWFVVCNYGNVRPEIATPAPPQLHKTLPDYKRKRQPRGDSTACRVPCERAWRERGFPGNAVHKAALLSQTAAISDITCKMKWKWHPKFSENSRFPSEIQWYKNTRTGFLFWNVQSVLNQAFSPPANHSNSMGFIFVISQLQENNFVVQTSRSL